MKKIINAIFTAVVISSFAFADITGEFRNLLEDKYLKPFAKDIGAVLGGGWINSPAPSGFPGFDISARFPFMGKPNEDNLMIKNAGINTFGFPFLQAEIGLPANFSIIARTFPVGSFKSYGGGIRYKIFSSGVPATPIISVLAGYTQLSHDYFKVSTISFQGSIGLKLPVISSYIGVGIDQTAIESNTTNSLTGTGLGLKTSATGFRLFAGLRIGLGLIYISGTATYVNSVFGGEASAGISF